jgi:hypothetical protein
MAKVQKIGCVTFRELTNEEALHRHGSSFVFAGSRPASLEQAVKAAGDGAVKRLAEEIDSEERELPSTPTGNLG